jgi:hypothetical protein
MVARSLIRCDHTPAAGYHEDTKITKTHEAGEYTYGNAEFAEDAQRSQSDSTRRRHPLSSVVES